MSNLNNHWLENVRNETLTSFFKLFPYLASDYFYIIVLALGFWMSVRKRLFIDLGFLVPFSTLINIILKNSFAIARPPEFLHLVPNHVNYGFPSGDVQVGMVFWGMIFLNTKSISLRVVSCLAIIGISMSRIYLGVHSFADVLGGLLFGGAILFIYNCNYGRKLQDSWLENSTGSYWYILLLVSLIYAGIAIKKDESGFALVSIGVLVGLGIVFKNIDIKSDSRAASIFQALCSLIILFIFYKFFPLYKTTKFVFYLSAIVKYAMLTLMIYAFLPLLQRKINIDSRFMQRN